MKITVIGCGRWGSFIAWYLDSIRHDVTLYGRPSSAHMEQFMETRSNGMITLPETLSLTTALETAIEAPTIVISIAAQSLRSLMQQLKAYDMKNKTIILCMKGIEMETGLRLTQIAEEYVDESVKIAVWVGPGHVQEFYHGVPNCMVIDSKNEEVKKQLVEAFSSNLIRFYYGQDLIGSEVGAAAKNVIGIAAGMLDGLEVTSLKGALMSRGTREVARLIKAMGGNELSAYGLCHLGDYEATVFSQFSHNRQFGESFVRGEKYTALAEGYYTTKALLTLAEKYQTEMPIVTAVYQMLYEHAAPKQTLDALFSRSIKNEF